MATTQPIIVDAGERQYELVRGWGELPSGSIWGPHGIWTDSVGDLYIAEVLEGARLQKFARRR
jgi:hypothetical protein